MEKLFQLAVEASPNGVILMGEDGNIVLVNSKVEEIFEYTRDELINQSVGVLVPNTYRNKHPGFISQFLKNPKARSMGSGRDLYGLSKTGKEVPLEIGLNPLEINGKTHVLASVVNISERKRAEQEMRSLNDQIQLALEASPNGILLMNNDGNIILVNSAIEKIFGYSRNELIGQSVGNLVPSKYRDQHPNFIQQFFKSPKARAMGAGRDLYGLSKTAKEVPLEIGLNPLEISGVPHVLASVVDISERKQAEQERRFLNDQIQMAQRMESLGVLAGGTAHDFNNILYAISGNAELAQMRAQMGENISSYLNNIVRSCTRASELTKQMLAYAGKGTIVYSKVNLNALIIDMLNLLESSIPKDIKIRPSLVNDLPDIEADGSQLQQIVMNLITNAREAIGDHSGEIDIRTGLKNENKKSLKTYRQMENMPEGEYVYIEVSDTGSGMTQDVIENMFDPFYTTKFTGRGLGMAAVLGIVRSHNGAIRVKSEVNKGTLIRIIFPTDAVISGIQDSSKNIVELKALIVDDEPEVRDVLKQMLEVNKFSVTIAKTGTEAIKLIDGNENYYDLVVLDMNMPGMAGTEVYREFKKRNVQSKLIFISGYSEEEMSSLFTTEALNEQAFPNNFLQKPFKYNDIKALLERMFD